MKTGIESCWTNSFLINILMATKTAAVRVRNTACLLGNIKEISPWDVIELVLMLEKYADITNIEDNPVLQMKAFVLVALKKSIAQVCIQARECVPPTANVAVKDAVVNAHSWANLHNIYCTHDQKNWELFQESLTETVTCSMKDSIAQNRAICEWIEESVTKALACGDIDWDAIAKELHIYAEKLMNE